MVSITYSVKEVMRKMASPHAKDLIALKKSSPLHMQVSTNGLQISVDSIEQQY